MKKPTSLLLMMATSFIMLACHGNVGPLGDRLNPPAVPVSGPTPVPVPPDCKEIRRCSDELRNIGDDVIVQIWREIRSGQPFEDQNGVDMQSLGREEKLALAGARLRAVILRTAIDDRGLHIGPFEDGSFLKLFWSFFDENGDLREQIDPKGVVR